MKDASRYRNWQIVLMRIPSGTCLFVIGIYVLTIALYKCRMCIKKTKDKAFKKSVELKKNKISNNDDD